MSIQVKLLGVRGTLPVHGPQFAEFGGGTGCVLLRAGENTLILDAGSGLCANAVRNFAPGKALTLLLSHPHADHLLGFPSFAPLFDPTYTCDIYLKTRQGMDARAQVESLMAPPLWPVTPSVMGAKLRFFDVPKSFAVGDIQIDTLDIAHPGGCTAYKITHEGRSVVYATDYEPASDTPQDFIAFAKGCSLLLIDGQYAQREYARTKGFGHATALRSAAIASACEAESARIIHHDPTRTDAQLRDMEREIQMKYPAVRFGCAGEEVTL